MMRFPMIAALALGWAALAPAEARVVAPAGLAPPAAVELADGRWDGWHRPRGWGHHGRWDDRRWGPPRGHGWGWGPPPRPGWYYVPPPRYYGFAPPPYRPQPVQPHFAFSLWF